MNSRKFFAQAYSVFRVLAGPALVFGFLGWATIGAAPFSCGKKDAGSGGGGGTSGATSSSEAQGGGGGGSGGVTVGSQTHSAEVHQAQATSALENAQKASKAAQQTATQINAAVKSIVKSIDDAQAKQASPFHFAPIDLLAPVPPANAPLPGLGGGPVNAAPALDATALINKVTEMDQHLGEQVKATDEAKKTGLKDSSKDTNTQLKDSVGKAAKAVTDASVTVKSEIGNLTTAASKVTGGAAPLQTPAQNLAPLLAALGKQVDEVNGNATKAVTELGAALDAQLKAEALKRQQELIRQESIKAGHPPFTTDEELNERIKNDTLAKYNVILVTGAKGPTDGGENWCPPCEGVFRNGTYDQLAAKFSNNSDFSFEEYYVPRGFAFPQNSTVESLWRQGGGTGVPYVLVLDHSGNVIPNPHSVDVYMKPGSAAQDLVNLISNSNS